MANHGGIFRVIARVCSYIEEKLIIVCAAILFFMMSLTALDVVMRYLFNRPIQGTYELMEFSLVGASALAFAYVQRVRQHIAISLITDRLSLKWRKLIDIVVLILTLVILILLTWRTGLTAFTSLMTGETTFGIIAFPVGPAKSVVPVGLGLLCLRVIVQIGEDITGVGKGGTHE